MRMLAAAVWAAFCLAVAAPATAQTYPAKPVRLVIPNSPGGPSDILARMIAQKLQEVWGQVVIVDYKPGAGTVTGTEYLVKSPPDGYTLGITVSSLMINPSLRTNLPYETLKDIAGVSVIAIAHVAVVATKSFEANTIPELIALAKRKPGSLSFATAGAGSGLHMTAELLKLTAGIDMVHVPYKGSGPAYPDVIAGRVPLMVDSLFSSVPYIKTGKLKALAVASLQRASNLPDVPTIAETLPGFNVQSTNGLIAPSATPRAVVQRVSADVAAAVRLPDVRARMAEIGLEPVGSTPEQYDELIRTEIEKWAKVVKFAGLHME